jgi:hypothetical protein
MSSPVSTISEIGKHEGQTVTIRGWLYNLRESGKLLFPQFRDGSGIIQGVVPKNAVTPEVFEAIKTLTQESSVIVEGKVRADKRAPGGYELDVVNVQVVQRVPESDPYPITPKEHGTDFLMEHRHQEVGAVFFGCDGVGIGFGHALHDLDVRDIEFVAAGRALVGANFSFDDDAGFLGEALQGAESFRILLESANALNDASAIAKDGEEQLAGFAKVVEPTTKGDFLPVMISRLIDRDDGHGRVFWKIRKNPV